MVEGWRRNTAILRAKRNLLIASVAVPLIFVGMAAVNYLSGIISWEMAVILVVVGIALGVADFILLRWFEDKVEENARKFVRQFRLPIDAVRKRLETGLGKMRVTFEKGRWDYRVSHDGTMVDVHLQQAGELTYVFVDPPEDGTPVEGLLELLGDLLG